MGRPKKDREEKLKTRRLAAQKRQEQIRNDPLLYQMQKENYKLRYQRRKMEKKILPISEMSDEDRRVARERSRNSSRVHYMRKTGKLPLKTSEKLLERPAKKTGKILLLEGATHPEDACNIEPEVILITEPLPENDPLNVKPEKCCLCAEITDHVDTEKPYLENNKMTLTLNGIDVEMDFNKDRQRVCLNCDKKLVDIFNFVQQVRMANSLLNASYDREQTIKTECESPILDDNGENDENDEIEDVKEEIVDAITIDETAFVKEVSVHKKRKSDKKQHTALKKVKVEDKTCDDSDRIMDIKEATEMDDINTKIHETGYSVNRYTGPDINPKTRKINSLINKKL